MHLLYIGFFGGLGCVLRYLASSWTYLLLGRDFPYGTLVVNVLGSLMLGMLMTFGLRGTILSTEIRLGIAVGFMGGFTTFSTFSYETLRLLEDGNLWQAGINIGFNIVLCLVFTAVGVAIARYLS